MSKADFIREIFQWTIVEGRRELDDIIELFNKYEYLDVNDDLKKELDD